MSLDWNLTKIQDYQSACWVGEGEDKRLNPVTEALIFSCILVGIGEITKQNAQEWYVRVHACEHASGAVLRTVEGGARFITPADVQAHIGLSTNVFPKVTDAVFAKNLWRNAKEAGERAWRWAQEHATDQDTPVSV